MLITNNNFKLSILTLDIATQTLMLNLHTFKQLKPQSFELLRYLCHNHHKIVSRDELIAHVWHNRIVSDNAINRAVSQLRLAIAQLDPEQEYIQTLPRAGYRLSVNVTPLSIETTASDDIYVSADLSPLITTSPQRTESSDIEKTVQAAETTWHLGIHQTHKKISTAQLMVFVSCIFLLLVSITLLSPWLVTNKAQQQPILTSKPQSYAPGAEYDASISRDWVVYINRNEHEFAVIASNRHNSEVRVVHKSLETIRFPKLSPNIDLISVFLRKNERLGLRSCQLNIMRFHSAELIKQYPCGLANVVTQRWLTPSQVQIVTAKEGHGLKIMVLDLNRNEQQPGFNIPFTDEGLQFISVQLSPDGQEIGLLSRNMVSKQTHLTVFSISSLAVKRSIILPGVAISAVQRLDNGNFIWLESGKLFQTNSEGLNRTTQMTDLTAITQLNAVYDNALFVSHGQTRTNLIGVAKDGKEVAQVVSSKDEFMPVFSHNSAQFAFFSNRNGQLELWLSNGQSTAKKLTLPEQALLLKPIQWSPDDSHLVITTKLSVLIYSLAEGKVQETNINSSRQAVWINNNVLVILKDSSAGDLVMYDRLTGIERHVSLPYPILNVQVADETLYFSQKGNNDIWQYNFDTKQEQALGVKANTALGMWQIKKGVLYYVPVSQEKLHIARLDLATGSEQTLYYFNIADAPVFSISSSERIILQRQVQDETDVSSLLIH